MTVDEIKAWLPIFQAVADGKGIQVLGHDGFWVDNNFEGVVIGLGASRYRVKDSGEKVEKSGRFDPTTLKPFDKVLVRDGRVSNWRCKFFSHIIKPRAASFVCTDSIWSHCIPYNEDTKHLANSNQEAPEYYRYWED